MRAFGTTAALNSRVFVGLGKLLAGTLWLGFALPSWTWTSTQLHVRFLPWRAGFLEPCLGVSLFFILQFVDERVAV